MPASFLLLDFGCMHFLRSRIQNSCFVLMDHISFPVRICHSLTQFLTGAQPRFRKWKIYSYKMSIYTKEGCLYVCLFLCLFIFGGQTTGWISTTPLLLRYCLHPQWTSPILPSFFLKRKSNSGARCFPGKDIWFFLCVCREKARICVGASEYTLCKTVHTVQVQLLLISH